MLSYILFPVLSTLMTALACLGARRIGHALMLIDKPAAKAHALHEKETPLVGGLAILIPWIIAALAYAQTLPVPPTGPSSVLLSLPLLSLVIFFLILGALDDRYHLSPRSRLWISVLAYFSVVMQTSALQIGSLSMPGLGLSISLGYLAAPFTVLCLVALTNAVNMADGRNSLVIGMCCIWVITLFFRLPEFASPMALGLAAALIVAGICNWRGRLFLGDAGAYALACLIGLWAIWTHQQGQNQGGLSSTQLGTLFAIPAFDMIRLIVLRLHKGVSIMSPDNDHLHHRLDRFCGWNIGLVIYLLMVAAPITVAVTGPRTGILGLSLALTLYALVWAMTRQAASPKMSPL